MKTITVPTTGKPPTRGSKVFLDRHGAGYVLPPGSGPLSKPHSVALCIGIIGGVSNGTADIRLLESHAAADFVEELAEQDHLRLTTDDRNCSHLILTESPGSSGGQIQESVSVPIMESKMNTPTQTLTRHAPRIVADIVNAPSFTAPQKLDQIQRYMKAIGGRRLTESVTSRGGRGNRRVADVLRGCRRSSSVALQESAGPGRFRSIKFLLRNCAR